MTTGKPIDAHAILLKVGPALGNGWQTEIAKACKTSDRQVRRWVSGEAATPDDIGATLKRMIDRQVEALRKARKLLS